MTIELEDRMKRLLTTKEVAEYLKVNEKMVYTLVSEKGLPASKVTGKWIFPMDLVDQWIENSSSNYPESGTPLPPYHGLIIITGSNDPLLERALSWFNARNPDQIVVFGNLGSAGGIRALRRNLCHIASSHLLQENEEEYNFDVATRELGRMPAIVNFCRREQGLVVPKGNPKQIGSVSDLGKPGIRIINRPLGTGTRLLLDHELRKAGLKGEKIDGYGDETARHLEVGLQVHSGRADAGPAIRAVAGLLDLDFVPLRWERYDLMISKERFFDEGVQRFLGVLHDKAFRKMAGEFEGYDVSRSGKMVFPRDAIEGKEM
jgi:putative molybdopterin biosynthesis protein